MEKALGFARVSSEDQAEGGISLGLQAEAIRAYCRQKGFQLSQVVEVTETATFHDQRVKFQAMLTEFAASSDMRHLVFYKVDRSNRNFWDHAKLADLVIVQGKHLHAALDHFHLHPEAPPSEWDRFDMMALFARSETRHLSSRVRSCIQQQVSMGLYTHRAPPGYRKIFRGGIEIDPVQGPLMKELLELAATGVWSLDRLAKTARETGINCYGRPLSRSAVHRWVTNPIFAGPFYCKGKLITNYQHTPLISWETHEKIAKRLKIPGRMVKRTRRGFPLSGVFTCAHCHRAVTFFTVRKRYTYGVCCGCRRDGYSPKNLTEENLFFQLEQIVKGFALTPEVAADLKGWLEEERGQEEEKRKAKITALQDRINSLKQKLVRAFSALSDGAVDQETYQHQSAQWRAEKEKLEIQLREVERSGLKGKLDELLKMFELAEGVETIWESATPHEKALLAKSACLNLAVDEGTVRFSLAFPFDHLAEGRECFKWRPRRDLNPCYQDENLVSWTSLDDGVVGKTGKL